MTRLFSYCIPNDSGAAPNPFWGICTLAICKPVIRRKAEVGDWIVGTGSSNSPIGDLSGMVVYAMRVTGRLSMEEYDVLTRTTLTQKIPDVGSRDMRRVVGDSLYDFSKPGIPQRRGVHDRGDREKDLGGRHVLLSKEFLYCGDQPIPLPPRLRAIAKQGQGHRVDLNAPYVGAFVDWITSRTCGRAEVLGQPQKWRTLARGTIPGGCGNGQSVPVAGQGRVELLGSC